MPDQPGWDDYEHLGCKIARSQLRQHDPGLNCLSEPDLVRQDGPAGHLPKSDRGRPELVVEGFEP